MSHSRHSFICTLGNIPYDNKVNFNKFPEFCELLQQINQTQGELKASGSEAQVKQPGAHNWLWLVRASLGLASA